MLADIEKARKAGNAKKKVRKKERNEKAVFECLIQSLGLVEAWSEFRIKVGQNGFYKNTKFGIRHLEYAAFRGPNSSFNILFF